MSKVYKSLQDLIDKSTAESTDSVVLTDGKNKLTLAKVKAFIFDGFNPFSGFTAKTTAVGADEVPTIAGKKLTLAKIKTFVLKNFNPFSDYGTVTQVTDTNTLPLLDASKTTTALILKAYINAEQGTAATSNLTIDNADPSGGKANDIWIKTDTTKILSISVNDDGTWKSVDLSTL